MDKQTNTAPGFRAVFRGKTSKGVYKRAVRTVHAKDYSAAAAIVATRGETLAKGCGFRPEYVTILPPLM